MEDVIERIKKKTIFKNDCWIFTGKLTGRRYGNIWYNGKMVRIGRLICHLIYNADLDDLSWTVNHKLNCPNTACWNPEHLYVGTFHYGTSNLNGGDNFNRERYLEKKRNK